MPMSVAARTTSRTAATPATCPACRGRWRLRAHRPLPSMMMATWRGGLCMSCGAAAMVNDFPAGRSYLHDLLLLAVEHLIDFLYVRVGQLLQFIAFVMMLVLADLVVLLELLEDFHAIPAHIADGDPRLLGVFGGELREFLAP